MTKEERAKKWFGNIPNAESVGMETKIEICDKTAKKMVIIFFAFLVLEGVLLVMLGGGKIFDLMATFLNKISKGAGNSYKGVALVGVLVCFPLIIFPLIAAFIYKNKCLRSEMAKVDRMKNTQMMRNKESTEDVLHFDHLNFKLAIIQVLMYDLELLEPKFDICEFVEKCKEEEMDTGSNTVFEPALRFFKNLPIPKGLATQVETVYMDGGNEVYMNIIPEWDGEEGCFDLNEITLSELQQFPNLKKATVLSGNFNQIKEVFDTAKIEVELL